MCKSVREKMEILTETNLSEIHLQLDAADDELVKLIISMERRGLKSASKLREIRDKQLTQIVKLNQMKKKMQMLVFGE